MSIEVERRHNNRLIIVHFIGPLDFGEYQQFVLQIHAELYDQAKQPIHTVLDLSRVSGFPRNVISNALSVSKLKHPNDGLIFFVADNSVIYRFLEIFVRLSKDPNHIIMRTVDAAVMQIEAALLKEPATQLR